MLSIFIHLLTMCGSFWNSVYTDSLSIFNWFTYHFIIDLWESLYILEKNLVKYMICKYFIQFCGLSFHFLTGIILAQSWSFCCSPLFPFVDCTFSVTSKKLLPNLRIKRFPAMFSSKSFIFFALTFRTMIHFELFFVYGVR